MNLLGHDNASTAACKPARLSKSPLGSAACLHGSQASWLTS